MGYGILTLPALVKKLEHSPKDWCLVAIHDPENQTRAGCQLDRLLNDLDEDSGSCFDFFLPGYDGASQEVVFKYALIPSGEPIRWRKGDARFDHDLFRDFVKGIENLPSNQWRYNGDCSFLLFQTSRRSKVQSLWDLELIADYNLDDIVMNGQTVNQFLRRMCIRMETIGCRDVATVKSGLDEIYRELIMPPENRSPEQDLRLREGAGRLAKSHPARGYVFVSCSTKDRSGALQIRKLLESAGIKCWMAPRDIPPGSNYAYVIERAISNCALFLLLLTRDSVQSVWVNKEVLYALGKHQCEGRVQAAWLSKPFDLEKTGSGMAFALQDVQIESDLSEGDSSSILYFFLTKGICSPEQVPVQMWRDAFVHHPNWANDSAFSSRCPWNQFSSQDWHSVLKTAWNKDCDLEKAIPFNTLSPSGWANLLSRAPIFSAYCKKWDDFTSADWLVLLRARPDFAEKCRNWAAFSPQDWDRLLFARPELGRFRKQPGD